MRGVQLVVLIAGSQAWHSFAGFCSPFVRHVPPMKHDPGEAAWPHAPARHVASVQAIPSSGHSLGSAHPEPPSSPLTQVPPLHVPEVQLIPHDPQFSGSVSRFDSQPGATSQSWNGELHMHESAEHVSFVPQTVPHDPQNGDPATLAHEPPQHTLDAPHGVSFGAAVTLHPVASHESTVQGFASSQMRGSPSQSPPAHRSLTLHASPSSQDAVFDG